MKYILIFFQLHWNVLNFMSVHKNTLGRTLAGQFVSSVKYEFPENAKSTELYQLTS